MNTNTYNGWSNYETWLVNLWLTSDDPYTAIEARLYARQGARKLQDWIEEKVSPVDAPIGLATDLLRSALMEVNWKEITENLLED